LANVTTSTISNWLHSSGFPAEVSSFVGRRHEVAEVKRLLSGSRLVTLTGPGGVGKSRLAARVALTVRRAFPDGAWLVELADLENPELLVAETIEALSIHDHSARPEIEALTEHLRGKRALVILDNCEHLLDPCAALTETLLCAAPELRILTTSREPLRIAGEQTFAVPTMSLPAAGPGHRPRPPASSDAVRLFAERAEAVLPGFAVTEANQEAVEQICRLLDGIPLGIEMAVVRLRSLSVQELLSRLDDRFGLLTAGSRTAVPRHRTLRALIDWSYGLCTAQERLLWQRASVFSGSLDLEAAEAVCDGQGIAREEVIDLVTGLVDKSILIREDHLGAVRYRLLETVRQYGRERLVASGAEADLRRRHRDWYRDLVVRADQEWFGPRQVAWFTRLRLEHGNIRAALDGCLSKADGTECGLTIATALRLYWIAAGLLHEGRRWFDALLIADEAPTALRADALALNAKLAVFQSDFTAAESMIDKSRALAFQAGDTAVLAEVGYLSGVVAYVSQDWRKAVPYLTEALDLYRQVNSPMGVGFSLMSLAWTYSFLGDSDRATALFEECMKLCEPRSEHYLRPYVMCYFGLELWRQGDTTRAVEMECQSIRLKHPFDDRLGTAMSVEILAWITADEGDYERAARLLGALEEIWRSVGGPVLRYMAGYHDECEALVREHLGRTRFNTVFREGARLTFDQVVGHVLEERTPAARPPMAARLAPLTRRETEVARLVAEGKNNKEIAGALLIAQRTAEGHIEHILSKLGFNSRTQIAVWFAQQDRASA
jgi:non-specific serine/threonine protein kinase